MSKLKSSTTIESALQLFFAFSASALKDDFVLILHQDRKEHRIMSYINLMEQLTLAEQEETVKLLCNMCGMPGSFDWLMYISEVSKH